MARQYVPGDVATGFILGDDNQWHPDPLSDLTGLHQDALARLQSELLPDEQVCVVVLGVSNQATIGMESRVFVTSFSYLHISGVQLHKGMISGAVVLQGSGLTSGTNTNYWKNGDDDPYKAPNAIPIVRGLPMIEERVARLRHLVHQAQTKQQSPTTRQQSAAESIATGGSIADEMRKLAELRREGLISEEEFKEMSASVLGRG